MPRICYYVTGHGFGHAARAQALIEALLATREWSVEVRTSVVPAFFAPLLGGRCQLTRVDLDPGVVQSDSFDHDRAATCRVWTDLLRRSDELILAESEHVRASGCDLVLSDVSPIACAAGARAGLPTVALGNFTWDWILEPYCEGEPGLADAIARVRELYRGAELYLRLPMSPETDLFARQEQLPLIARHARRPAEETRRALGLEPHERMVLLGFGGFGIHRLGLEGLRQHPELRCFWDREPASPPGLTSLAGEGHYYPDLVRAADAVVSKPGYSIIAETIANGTPLVYAPRSGFRESALLEEYLAASWPSLPVSVESLADGAWIEAVGALLREPRALPRVATDGAARAVEILSALGA